MTTRERLWRFSRHTSSHGGHGCKNNHELTARRTACARVGNATLSAAWGYIVNLSVPTVSCTLSRCFNRLFLAPLLFLTRDRRYNVSGVVSCAIYREHAHTPALALRTQTHSACVIATARRVKEREGEGEGERKRVKRAVPGRPVNNSRPRLPSRYENVLSAHD